MLEMFGRVISWEDSILYNEDEAQEGLELDCLIVIGALGVISRPTAEVEAQLD